MICSCCSGVWDFERIADGGRVADHVTLLEVLAEHANEKHVVTPPLAHGRERRTGGRAHCGSDKVLQRKVHRPGWQGVEIRRHELQRLVAVVAVEASGECGRREHPVGTDGIIAHDIERHVGAGKKPAGFDEVRLCRKIARVRRGIGFRFNGGEEFIDAADDAVGSERARARRVDGSRKAILRCGVGGPGAGLGARLGGLGGQSLVCRRRGPQPEPHDRHAEQK